MKIRVVLKKKLSVTESEVDDGLVYHVQDPQSGETFEFGEKQWFLLSGLDAATLPIEIIEKFKLNFNAGVPLEQFKSLLEIATECGLCEDLASQDNSNENMIRTLPSTEILDEERGMNLNATPFSNVLKGRHSAT